MVQKLMPGFDASIPEPFLGFEANSLDMDKSALKHFRRNHTPKGIKDDSKQATFQMGLHSRLGPVDHQAAKKDQEDQ